MRGWAETASGAPYPMTMSANCSITSWIRMDWPSIGSLPRFCGGRADNRATQGLSRTQRQTGAHFCRIVHESQGALIVGLLECVLLTEPVGEQAHDKCDSRVSTVSSATGCCRGRLAPAEDQWCGCRAHLVKPFPSIRTTIQHWGSRESGCSKPFTYS